MISLDELRANPGQILGAITAWAKESGAINLGQGFPELSEDEERHPALVAFLQNAREMLMDHNAQQYQPPRGLPVLKEVIATNNQHFYGLETDPDTEILVTSGANNAISLAMRTLLNGDDQRNEVLLIEPYFNFYPNLIKYAGGDVKSFSLDVDDNQEWNFDFDRLEKSITDKTKVILLNSPMNPTGKVFSRAELEAIADIVRRHDLYVISDDVYAFQTHQDHPHASLAMIDGMKDRCISVNSAGKTFSATGWRVGYATGPEHVINPMAHIFFNETCCVAKSFQQATAQGLQDHGFLRSLGEDYKMKAQTLSHGLERAGFSVSPAQGGYFVAADYSDISDVDGIAFVEHMIKEHGVAAVPFDPAFVSSDNRGGNSSRFLRFCVAKPADVLAEAASNLLGIQGPS